MARLTGRLAFTLLGVGAAYDVWHPVDISAVVCPLTFEGADDSDVNYALNKPATCSGDFNYGSCDDITDGNGLCSDPPISAILYSCSSNAFFTIDMEASVTFDEVNLDMSSDCNTIEDYCGFEVQVSSDSATFNTVYTARNLYQVAPPGGFSFKFAAQTARYVRVYVGPGTRSGSATIQEVKVFHQRGVEMSPTERHFQIPISSHSSLDAQAPHIVTFIRSENVDTGIDFDMVDSTGKNMVQRQTITLQEDPMSPPSSCQCVSPPTFPESFADLYGADYGRSCSNWDQDNCQEWWGDSTTMGEWCCWNWCYADSSCPDAYKSSVIEGAWFSYAACKDENDAEDFSTCPLANPEVDACECRNVYDVMDDRMKSMFPADYGSSCFAWDSLSCEANYQPWQLDSWCCMDWCYVDATCPQAQDTMNPGMLGKLFWTATPCEQDAQLVSQCTYKAQPNITEAALDACQCLEVEVPQEYRKTFMTAEYGKTCGPHDKDFCDSWYADADHDMWCCSSWCWVSPECPDASASSLWPGSYYSSLTCAWDVDAAKNCQYSTACQCTGTNDGIDTNKFGVDYGTSCSTAWDAESCGEWYGGTSWWLNETRNDWCCAPWCYVNESCPIADPSSIGSSGSAVSYDVCGSTEDVYYQSSDSCGAPTTCECSGEGEGEGATYGAACEAHDLDNCVLQPWRSGLDCCTPWCFVDEGCNESFPHPDYPGKFMSYQTCEESTPEYQQLLVSCPHSDVCRCANDNTGIDASFFGSDYGKTCAAHDGDNCYTWWGPHSPAGIWDTNGNNNWCCDEWCYVSSECPVYDGFGQSIHPYSYIACASENPGGTYDEDARTCSGRRLEQGVVESCEDFFLLDGRSPVELPDTWAEAREAFQTMCLSEGHDESKCGEVVSLVFEKHPDDETLMHTGTKICSRLLIAGAAAAASPEALLKAQEQDFDVEAAKLAAGVHSALAKRAGRIESSTDSQNARAGQEDMDAVLLKKLGAWTGPGGAMLEISAPLRRMKGTSSGSSGGWGGSSSSRSSPVPVARRRTPSRPAATSTRRRAPPQSQDDINDMNSGVRRRRSIMGGNNADRRRTTDFSNQRHQTQNGQAYGYTDKNYMYNSYGNQFPAHTGYGYSATNVYQARQRKSIGMGTVAAAGVGGAALGVGGYYLYNQHYNPSYYGDDSWRRRRAGNYMEWCEPPASSSVDLMECTECYAEYTWCNSMDACGSSCGIELKRDYGRDDLISTGFVPSDFVLPFALRIYGITGSIADEGSVCPPTTPAEASLAANFGRSYGIRLDLFATLTQLETLSTPGDPLDASGSCNKFTEYECKYQTSAAAEQKGNTYCYGENEICKLESASNKYMCYCEDGYCLEGSSVETRSCHMIAAGTTPLAASSLVLFVVAALAMLLQ